MQLTSSGIRGLFVLAFIVLSTNLAGAEISKREGWVVRTSPHSVAVLADRIQEAARAFNLGVVSKASATVGAKRLLNMDIPGNMVIGLYHPSFAVRMLDASIAAGIEAPIRVYITENKDGTATLSYKTPSHVFAPYMDEGGKALQELSGELDTIFDQLSQAVTSQ